MSFTYTTPDFWNTLLLVIIWIHLYLTMNTTYFVYIFGDTDVGLLCWLTEKQIKHCLSHLFNVILGVGGVFVPLTKNSYYGNISQESLMTTVYIARVFINILEAVSHKKFPSVK